MTLEKRKEILKRNGACFKCTKGNHSARNCKNYNIQCKKCKFKHATSMCDPNFNKGDNSRKENVKSVNLATRKFNATYLQTACAYIKSPHTEHKSFIRLVLDGVVSLHL